MISTYQYSQFIKYLKSEFNKLLKEFELPKNYCTIIIRTSSRVIKDFIIHDFNISKETDGKLLHYGIKNLFKNLTQEDNNTIMYCLADYNEETKVLSRRLIIPEKVIMSLLLFNDIELVKQYCKLLLRHELGHHLYDDYLYEKLGYEKGEQYLYNQYNKDLIKYEAYKIRLKEQNKYSSSKVFTYYNTKIKQEIKANEYGKVDVKELIKCNEQIDIYFAE